MKIEKDLAEKRLTQLIGETITHCWRGYGSAIFIELGDLVKDEGDCNPRGQQTIMVQWSWRIENSSSIVMGSWSDDDLINTAPRLLIGQSVEAASFFGRLAELTLKLSELTWFTTFATAEGDPQWAIKGSDDSWLSFKNGAFKIEKST